MKKSFFLIAYLVIFFLGLSAVSFAATKEVLDNGLTILVKEDHAHPIVTVHANVSAGLSSEGEYLGCGISHFVEHMLFKGTSKRKADDIEHEVKSYGGAINASTNLPEGTPGESA